MSLDGFIAPESPEQLMGQRWMELQQWAFPQRFIRENLKLGEGGEEGRDNDILRETFERTGASVMGKRMFDAGEEMWPEEAPFHTPVFVVTHEERDPWERQGGTTLCCWLRNPPARRRRRGPRGPGSGSRGADAAGDPPDLRSPGAVAVSTSALPPRW